MRWQEEHAQIARRQAQLESDAANWHSAMDFITEKKMVKEFLLWEAKRNGASDYAYAALDRATDKITYSQNPEQQ